jgi:uncharacterized protein YjbJ (UPF0337 family)
MKSSVQVAVKGKFHEVKGKTKDEAGTQMSDPTLEGKDQNTIERIQRKTRRSDNAIKK